MKKGLFLTFALVILFSFSTCGPSSQEVAPTPAPTPTPSQIPTPTPIPSPATTPTPTPSPVPTTTPTAEFKVASLDIKPPEVTAGETANITAVVENAGDIEGTYEVILTVDGFTAETKDVSITPGSSQLVTFSLVKDAPGVYEIGVGLLNSSLTVKEKPIIKEIELKYDGGKAEDFFALAPWYGYIVDFTPPETPFTINKVRIFGVLAGIGWEGKSFTIAIWDADYEILHLESYSVAKFSEENPAWVDAEMPDIKVTDKFYVHVFTGTGRNQGIYIGVDDSIVNEHSDATIKKDETFVIASEWPIKIGKWFDDKSKVNWMIRVVGAVK